MKAKPRPPKPAAIPPPVGPQQDSGEDFLEAGSLAYLRELAHELSQPLTAMRGMLELALISGENVAAYRQAVRQALEPAERLARLVSLLRELAATETVGGLVHPTLLSRVVEEVAEDLRLVAETRNANLVREGGEGVWVLADEGPLRETLQWLVLRILLRGAAPGTVRITISSSPSEARLVIADERPSAPEMPSRCVRPPSGESGKPQTTLQDRLEWVIARRRMNNFGASLSVEQRANQRIRVRLCFLVAPQKAS